MSLASTLAAHLPFLRRHARALTGSQEHGDALVSATLEAIVADRTLLPDSVSDRLALFKAFQGVWVTSPQAPSLAPLLASPQASLRARGASGGPATDPGAAAMATARLAAIMPAARQALLLAAMEGFTEASVGYLIERDAAAVRALIEDALAEIARQTRTRVLIIEDEPIIAMDIETIVAGLGHGVVGIASTHREAMAMMATEAPGLVLADIQLRDGSSGIDSVRQILAHNPVPAIFITGFPERLLTGERPEPTFLITKPFQAASVRAAIGQALFFNSTAPPHG